MTSAISAASVSALLLFAACKQDRAASPPPPAKRDAGVDLEALREHVKELEDHDQLQPARDEAKRLVTALRAHKPNSRELADALVTYGRLLDHTGGWNDAESALGEALRIPGLDARLRSDLLFHLGSVHDEQRRSDLAAKELEESLALSEQVYGASSEAVLRTSEALATAYDYNRDYKKAEPLFRRALAAYEVTKDPVDLGRAQMNLALNLEYQERIDEALALYRKAETTLVDVKGYDRLQLAETYAGIGRVQHRTAKQLRAAEASYRKALATRIEAVGETHPLVAMDLYNLAVVLEDEGRIGEALATCIKSQDLRREALAQDHPHRIQTEELCERLRTKKH